MMENFLRSVVLHSLKPGSLFIWNNHLYEVLPEKEEDKILARPIAAFWTANPDDRWIACRDQNHTTDFHDDCMVWQLKYGVANPRRISE